MLPVEAKVTWLVEVQVAWPVEGQVAWWVGVKFIADCLAVKGAGSLVG